MTIKQLSQPASIAGPQRGIVIAFLRAYTDREVRTLRNHFGIELTATDLPTSDEDYLRLPIAELCAMIVLIAAGETRGLRRPAVHRQIESLLEDLFTIPNGEAYEIPQAFWLSQFGNLVLLARVWSANDELITVSEAVELTGRRHDFFTHAAQRGKLTVYPDIHEPNPTKRSRLLKSEILGLLK